MTRVTPNPGQIAQIQTTGVAAQQIGQVRPGSPPPPDLSRLNRFANLSRSVTQFLDAYGDNDRLKSRQEADAAFAQMPQEIREKLSSGDPKERIAALDGYLDGLVKSGQFNRADHPRFRNQFYAQAARAEVNDLATRLEGRLSDAQAIYDENGSFVGEADPESILAEEMEAMKGAVALSDPFAVRQVGGELLQVQESFRSAFGKARSQAMEQAARDQVKDQVLSIADGLVAESLAGGVPIEEADLSSLVQLMEEARNEYGMEDSRRLVVAGFQSKIGQLLANDQPEAADALLDRLSTLRDSNRNPIIRDADTLEAISELREGVDREIERKEDRERTEELQERAIQITRGQSEILRHIYADYEGDVPYDQIDRTRRILIERNYDPAVQGELLQFLTNELDRAKRRDAASDPQVLRNLRQELYQGNLTEQEITEAVAADEISGPEGTQLSQELQLQSDLYDGMGDQARGILEDQTSSFSIPGAPAEVETESLALGHERDQLLRGQLQDYWDTSSEVDPITRRAETRRMIRDFHEETKRIANERRVAFQERTSQAEGRLALMEAGYTLNIAAVNKERGNLTQVAYEDYIRRAQATEYRLDNIRKQVIGPLRAESAQVLETFYSSNFIEDPVEANNARTLINTQVEAIGDRFESDILPTLAGSPETGVIKAFREYAQSEWQKEVLPLFEPAAAELLRRIDDKEQSPQEALEDVGASVREVLSTVDLEKYPELRKYDSKRTPQSAVDAVVNADPKRQVALVRVLAPQLGMKADEILKGRAILTKRGFKGGGIDAPGQADRRVTIPTEFIANDSFLKYNTPFFTSKEQFRSWSKTNNQLDSLLKALRVPEADAARWTELQEDAIERVHGKAN